MSALLLELPGPREMEGGLWYSTPASTRFGRHYHQELELNVVVTGEARYWFPHRELRVAGPAALWIPPFVEHELCETSDDLSMWVYSFRTPAGQAREAAAGAASPPSSLQTSLQTALRELSDGPRLTGIPSATLSRLCARSREGLLRPDLPQFNDILSEIFALARPLRCPLELRREPAVYHPAAHRAARLLRESDDARSMGALARSTTLSRERLSRLFTRCFGIGLVQYRNHHRVQRFIHAYGQGHEANMLRAALDVGFGSYAQFHRAFKQVVGNPPAEHLELVRKGIVDPARTGDSASVRASGKRLSSVSRRS